jgi:hypothetical protein
MLQKDLSRERRRRQVTSILNVSEQSKLNATGVRHVQGDDTAKEPEEKDELVDILNFIIDDDDE